ncbi:MAG: SRPBCC family protein [Pseudomonadota bacterium]
MKTFVLAVAATALSSLVPSPAMAQDLPPRVVGGLDVDATTPAPLVVRRSVEVDADPVDVFATVSDDRAWVDWIDGVADVSRDAEVRTFALGDGDALSETIVAADTPSVFGWSIQPGNPMGLEGHRGVLHVTLDAEDGEGSIVTLSAYFDHAAPDEILPVVESGAAAITAGIADAHGGTLVQEVSGLDTITVRTVRIAEGRVDDFWSVMVDGFGDVADWSSVISEASFFDIGDTSNDGLLGVGRKCFIPGFGAEVQERVVEVDRAAGRFAYEVLAGLPPFASNGLSQWAFEDLGDGTVRVTSTVTMDIADGTPGRAVGAAKASFADLMTISIDEFVHFAVTGTPHPRELASRS